MKRIALLAAVVIVACLAVAIVVSRAESGKPKYHHCPRVMPVRPECNYGDFFPSDPVKEHDAEQSYFRAFPEQPPHYRPGTPVNPDTDDPDSDNTGPGFHVDWDFDGT